MLLKDKIDKKAAWERRTWTLKNAWIIYTYIMKKRGRDDRLQMDRTYDTQKTQKQQSRLTNANEIVRLYLEKEKLQSGRRIRDDE